MSSDPRESVEFVGAMPDQYEDEEYYGEEEDYAEDGEHEEYEDEPVAAGKPKPQGSMVRTALFALTGVIGLFGIAYVAMMFAAPDALNDIVNNLPFVGHTDPTPDPNAQATAPKGPKGSKAPKGTDVPGGDTPPGDTSVPPDPGKATAMHNPPKPGADSEMGAKPAGASGPAVVGRPHNHNHKPTDVAAVPPGTPTDGAPMEGVPPKQTPGAKPPVGKPPVAKPQPNGPVAKPIATAPGTKPMAPPQHARLNADKMAAARADWLKRHPKKAGATMTAYSRGPLLGWATRTVMVKGRLRRVRTPLYAVVKHAAPGTYPLATTKSMAALPAAWKHAPAPGRYAVQVGSFANTSNASQLVSQLRAQGIQAYTSTGRGRARVFIGHFPSREAAAVKMSQLQAHGVPAAVTIQ